MFSTEYYIFKYKYLTSWAALESNSLLSWNFLSKKFLGPKEFWVQKTFGSKKVLGPKMFWVQKIFESKTNFGFTKFWVQKNF